MQLHSAISVVASTGSGSNALTITCSFSAISQSLAETLQTYGVTATFMSATFSRNRSTTVWLMCSKEEEGIYELMEGLQNFKPFLKALDDLVWWSLLERSKPLEFVRYLGPFEPLASSGLSLVGCVTSRHRKVGK